MNAGKQAVLFEQAPAGQTIPFGKYKDQPVEILLTDPDYVTWLLTKADNVNADLRASLEAL